MDYTLEHNSYLTNLSQSEYYVITGGGFWDGLATVVEGVTTFVGGCAIMAGVSSVGGTSLAAAATILVGGFCGIGAAVVGVALVGYGIYQICN